MGRVITPRYRVEYVETVGQRETVHTAAWNSGSGRPNQRNLEDWRVKLNTSYQPGGVNEHIAKHYGVVPHVVSARLVNQKTGDVVAETEMPKFEVVG